MVKEYVDKIQKGKCSKEEVILSGICLFLIGIIVGIIIAPARFFTAGSFNENQGSIAQPEDLKKTVKEIVPSKKDKE